MSKFRSFDSLLDHITSHYSTFAERPADRKFVSDQLQRFAAGQLSDPAIVSANFSAVISPLLTCGVIIPVVLTISCVNPQDYQHSEWTCNAQSKEMYAKLNR